MRGLETTISSSELSRDFRMKPFHQSPKTYTTPLPEFLSNNALACAETTHALTWRPTIG